MTISQTIDALVNVPSTADPTNFDPRADNLFGVQFPTLISQLNTMGGQINTTVSDLNALAAGITAAISLDYTFDATTTDADPGPGLLRLSTATQTSALVVRMDLTDRLGTDQTAALDLLDDSTSAVKGYLKISKASDGTKFLVFRATALATPAGYRNITGTVVVSGGGPNPFTGGDNLTAEFTPTGDKGDIGLTGPMQGLSFFYSTTITVGDPTAGLFRLNSATLASATMLMISETAQGSSAVGPEIATWGTGGTAVLRGHLKIVQEAAPQNYMMYAITGNITDSGTYDRYTISFVGSNGTFTNNMPCRLQFYRAGADGVSGAGGGGGTGTGSVTLTNASGAAQVLTSTAPGQVITLPAANTISSLGSPKFAIYNAGPYDYTVVDGAAGLLGFVRPFSMANVSLADNTTVAGIWGNEDLMPIGQCGDFFDPSVAPTHQYSKCVNLDADRDAILLSSGSTLYGVVHNKTLNTWGGLTLLTTISFGDGWSAIKSATDQILIGYIPASGSTTRTGRTVTVSGTSLTPNTAATPVSNTGGANAQETGEFIQVGATFVLPYRTDSPNSAFCGFTISGTTVTVGAQVSIHGNYSGIAHLYPTSATVMIAIFSTVTSSSNFTCQPYTMSGGTTFTPNTAINFGGTNDSTIFRSLVWGTRWAVIWGDSSTRIDAALLSVSGTTVTSSVQTSVITSNGGATTSYFDVGIVNSKLVVGAMAAQVRFQANVLTDTAGVLSKGTEYTSQQVPSALLAFTGTVANAAVFTNTRGASHIVDATGASPSVTTRNNAQNVGATASAATAFFEGTSYIGSNQSAKVLSNAQGGYIALPVSKDNIRSMACNGGSARIVDTAFMGRAGSACRGASNDEAYLLSSSSASDTGGVCVQRVRMAKQ